MAIPGEEALGEAELLEPLAAQGLVAFIVRFADAVQSHAETLGQHLAELGLAGSRRPVQENVHPRCTGVESAFQHSFDVVSITGDVVEVRPIRARSETRRRAAGGSRRGWPRRERWPAGADG